MYPTSDDPAFGAFVAAQLRSLTSAGVDVTVDFVNGRRSVLEYPRAMARVARRARRERFDLVHAHYGLTGSATLFHRLPLVVTFYGDDLLGTPRASGELTMKSRFNRRLGFMAARRADAIICMSDEMRNALPRAADRARAHVIPCGIDINVFSPGERHAARERLGLGPDERLVLFPNTPTEIRKRLDLAQGAVAELGPVGLVARLWIVTGVEHDRMPDYYRAADCLLLTSDWEGSPTVVKEALCCDLPVVSVDAGDVRRWIELAPGSQLVERDPHAIARGLRDVLCGPRRIDGSTVRAEIGADRIATRIIDVYRHAIARHSRPKAH